MTGRIYAPGHVLYDDDGLEFVYRQPVDHSQLQALLSAAVAETCGGYAYLRCYSFWLDNRRQPAPNDRLPDLG